MEVLVVGESSSENSRNSEIMGLAVFKSDKLVGELSAEETLYHLLIKNELESCYISIPRSDTGKEPLDLYIYNKKNPKIKVEIVNGTPFIHLNLNLEARILSLDGTSSDISDEKLNEISDFSSQYIKNKIEQYLYRTSIELQSDIDGFGKYILSHFSTIQEFQDYNWQENYKNSFFDVTVNTQVQSAFLLSGK